MIMIQFVLSSKSRPTNLHNDQPRSLFEIDSMIFLISCFQPGSLPPRAPGEGMPTPEYDMRDDFRQDLDPKMLYMQVLEVCFMHSFLIELD